MLLIAIVDDEQKDSEALSQLVDAYFQQNKQAYMIHVFNSALDFIRSTDTDNHDIVFMDIRMDKMDGMVAAGIMRNINTDSALIFVSRMKDQAIKGYEVDALGFIEKPATQFSVNCVLDRALKRLESVYSTVFALKTSSGIVSISSNDIYFVEVFDHNLVYHTSKGDFDVRGRLSDVMKKLDEKRFIMCNRSYVVNLRHVSYITSDYLVVQGHQISISKSHRKEIMQHFSNFVGDHL